MVIVVDGFDFHLEESAPVLFFHIFNRFLLRHNSTFSFALVIFREKEGANYRSREG